MKSNCLQRQRESQRRCWFRMRRMPLWITDQTDVLDILAFLGIHTIEEVKRNPLTRSFEKKYPRCFEFLKNTEKW